MAIRFPAKNGNPGNDDSFLPGISSGWKVAGGKPAGAAENKLYAAHQMWQPSALSRPGNLGTAYSGVWTGDIKETF